MARIEEAQRRVRLLLHPEEVPLPSDDVIAEFLEKSATRLENVTARARQIDQVASRLNLAKAALEAARGKEVELPVKAKRVSDLKKEVEDLVSGGGDDDDDDSSSPIPGTT